MNSHHKILLNDYSRIKTILKESSFFKKINNRNRATKKGRVNMTFVAFSLWPSVSYHDTKILNATQRER